MARPFKQGLSYFPFDVKFFRDPRIRKVKNKYGYLGTHVYICILTLVYEQGYYLEVSKEELAELVYEELRGPALRNVDRITEVIDLLSKSELIDSNLMHNNVITSTAIQKQWLTSVSRRKNINKEKHWILSDSDEEGVKKFNDSSVLSSYPKIDNVNSNVVNVDNNSVNVDASTQKENKKEIDKDKKINIDKRALGEPKLHFITKILIKNKYIESDDPVIGRFNLLAADLVNIHGFDLVLSVTDYILKMFKKDHIKIDDKYDYFKVSAERNIKALEYKNNGGSFDIGKEIKDLIKTMGNND